MRLSVNKGELVLALVFVALGGLWIAKGARMSLWEGFAPSIFLMLLVLFASVERLPLARSIAVAAGVTAVLFLVFKTWLGVPLP